ncbi:MAG TPA: YiiD C-terminal domain-containing protein [Steroidobacteraceae bacterium]|nr:YiiD C-terminal domain-containing protein [Steroidobacteraceae bacterium]
MSIAEIERYLHSSVPLCRAMGVSVREASPARVRLAAPLAPNLNPHASVFGGSAVAIAILAAWTLLTVRERAAGYGAGLIIQRSSMRYERPITADFEALCELTDEARYARFRALLERRGRARITLTAWLQQDTVRAASFEGDFVGLRARERPR